MWELCSRELMAYPISILFSLANRSSVLFRAAMCLVIARLPRCLAVGGARQLVV